MSTEERLRRMRRKCVILVYVSTFLGFAIVLSGLEVLLIACFNVEPK